MVGTLKKGFNNIAKGKIRGDVYEFNTKFISMGFTQLSVISGYTKVNYEEMRNSFPS